MLKITDRIDTWTGERVLNRVANGPKSGIKSRDRTVIDLWRVVNGAAVSKIKFTGTQIAKPDGCLRVGVHGNCNDKIEAAAALSSDRNLTCPQVGGICLLNAENASASRKADQQEESEYPSTHDAKSLKNTT